MGDEWEPQEGWVSSKHPLLDPWVAWGLQHPCLQPMLKGALSSPGLAWTASLKIKKRVIWVLIQPLSLKCDHMFNISYRFSRGLWAAWNKSVDPLDSYAPWLKVSELQGGEPE